MAEVKKARLFLRRGTDTDRKTTVLCEGELGYSTDAFRLVIGDGSSDGGRSVGTTVHVSGGSLSHNFHTLLTEASTFDAANTATGGFALKGDLAVFPAATYTNVSGGVVSPGRYASTVMMLTAAVGSSTASPNADDATSWVAINSGIPWGNLHVQNDDITGDYISGGDISGDVTFSGTINTTKTTTTSAIVTDLAGTGNRNVFVTSTGQLTAEDNVGDGKTADGTLQFLASPVTISESEALTACDWLNYQNPSGVPKNATAGLFQFVWYDNTSTDDILMIRNKPASSSGVELSAAFSGLSDGDGSATQFFSPLSSNGEVGNDGVVGFDFKMFNGADTTTACWDDGHVLIMLGYM